MINTDEKRRVLLALAEGKSLAEAMGERVIFWNHFKSESYYEAVVDGKLIQVPKEKFDSVCRKLIGEHNVFEMTDGDKPDKPRIFFDSDMSEYKPYFTAAQQATPKHDPPVIDVQEVSNKPVKNDSPKPTDPPARKINGIPIEDIEWTDVPFSSFLNSFRR